jgi:hypothetical protein
LCFREPLDERSFTDARFTGYERDTPLSRLRFGQRVLQLVEKLCPLEKIHVRMREVYRSRLNTAINWPLRV